MKVHKCIHFRRVRRSFKIEFRTQYMNCISLVMSIRWRRKSDWLTCFVLNIKMKWSWETDSSIALFSFSFAVFWWVVMDQDNCHDEWCDWKMEWKTTPITLFSIKKILCCVAVVSVRILHDFSLLSKLWQLIFLNVVFSYFRSKFAISNELILSHLAADSWLSSFVSIDWCCVYRVPQSKNIYIYVCLQANHLSLLGSDVKSSEWTLIDCDIFSINIVIFCAHPSHTFNSVRWVSQLNWSGRDWYRFVVLILRVSP